MDRPSSGLITALNKMREMSVEQNSIYHQYVEPVTDATTIGEFGQPILDTQNLNVMNDFVSLMKKIVAVAVHTRTFNNPLAQLEGEEMPFGEFIEDVAVNPADANVFNVNDFGGLLEKYSAQVATQYLGVNSDLQYKVTITRDKIRNAFTSWNQLEKLFTGIVSSLYNGAYLQRYNDTRALVLGAYKAKSVPITLVDAVTNEATAKALTQKIRADFSKMQVPSTNYNGWNLVKTDKEFSLRTWADPEDMIVLVSADVDAINVVQNLSRAFNIDEAKLIGRVITVSDFNQYNKDGTVAVDGSAIQAMLCDKSWFKVKTQDFAMDEFFNPNNRCWTYFLNDVRMVNYSLFSPCMIYATEIPEDAPTPDPQS